MAKVKYVIWNKRSFAEVAIDGLRKICSYVENDSEIVFGRHGTNKSELRKILKEDK